MEEIYWLKSKDFIPIIGYLDYERRTGIAKYRGKDIMDSIDSRKMVLASFNVLCMVCSAIGFAATLEKLLK